MIKQVLLIAGIFFGGGGRDYKVLKTLLKLGGKY
jgi:hypothetical protein